MISFCLQWEGGRVVALGWTGSENLVCVLEEGTLVVYSIHGQQIYTRIIARVRKRAGVNRIVNEWMWLGSQICTRWLERHLCAYKSC